MFIKGSSKYDHYNTPTIAWDYIIPFIPKDKIIWEPFYSNGSSGKYLEQQGFNVIHINEDFFEKNYGDIIISNPPFSATNTIIERLIILDKPFILLMSASKLHTKTLRNYFKNNIGKKHMIKN